RPILTQLDPEKYWHLSFRGPVEDNPEQFIYTMRRSAKIVTGPDVRSTRTFPPHMWASPPGKPRLLVPDFKTFRRQIDEAKDEIGVVSLKRFLYWFYALVDMETLKTKET